MGIQMSEILGLVHKHLKVPDFIDGVLDGPVDKLLDGLVKSTSNPWDDALKKSLWKPVRDVLSGEIHLAWDKYIKPKPLLPGPV